MSMSTSTSNNPFVGSWTYRSLLNDADVSTDFDKLEFGRGTLVIEDGPMPLRPSPTEQAGPDNSRE